MVEEITSQQTETLVNPDGSFSENWLETKTKDNTGQEVNLFDDDTRGDQLTKSFKGLPDLVKSHRAAQKLVGRNKIVIPGDDAPDEEWDNVFKALGMPEKAEDYKLTYAETVPQELQNKENLAWYHQTARKYRLLPWQAAGIFKDWNDVQSGLHKKVLDDFNVSLETGMSKLKDKLGATFNEKMDACDTIINAVTDGIEEGDDIRERLENDVRRDPRVAQVFIRLGEMISEDRMGLIIKQSSFGIKPSEALAQIEEIKQDPAYLKEDDPKHKGLVERMTTLMRIAYPK